MTLYGKLLLSSRWKINYVSEYRILVLRHADFTHFVVDKSKRNKKNLSNNLLFSFDFPKDKVLKRNVAVFVSHILQQTQTGYLMVTQHVSTGVLRETNPSHVKLSAIKRNSGWEILVFEQSNIYKSI